MATQALPNLNQTQAAKLIGRKPQWLRDNGHEVPRNEDGSYSAEDLFEWQRSRLVEVDLPDARMEQVIRAADHFAGGEACRLVLIGLRDSYGEAGLAIFAQVVLDMLNGGTQPLRTETNLEAEVELERKVKRTMLFGDRLESVTQCGECKKIRHGKKWVKATERILPQQAVADLCPACGG